MQFETEPGTYELTEESVGSRFALVTIRTFVDPGDPSDVSKAHAAQDGIQVSGGGKGPFAAPDWDQEALATARKALSDLSQEGLVYSVQGKGTFVAAHKKTSGWVAQTGGLFADMTERGFQVSMRVLEVGVIPAEEHIARLLKVPEATPVAVAE